MNNYRMHTTPMEIYYKLHALQPELGEQSWDARTYQNAMGSIVYAAPCTCPDITDATSVIGRYAAQPSTLHGEAVNHLLLYLQGTFGYKLTIYDTILGHDSQSILCYANADLSGEGDTSESSSRIVVHALRILVIWKSKKQSLVAP